MPRVRIHITGIVQGVGMRPFVYREAVAAGIVGWVLNATDGVHIDAAAPCPQLDAFIAALEAHAPSAARIDRIDVEPCGDAGAAPADGFSIVASDGAGARTTLVSPDIATCDDCLRELFDPADRRYHYPFINCTNCGPRYTIIEALPYDRPLTSMGAFPMCARCAAEYADPLDRRFHAQPDACFDCGPHITWREAGSEDELHGLTLPESDAIIERCCELLRGGGIVAIKGLGGFHLACDAANERAVQELRRRKRRPRKALAVMVPDLACAEGLCHIDDTERALLTGSVRPIVLLRRKGGAELHGGTVASYPAGALAPSVALDLPEIGIMLPYTPLQHLIMASFGGPVVMTSGNVSGNPIEIDDGAAWERLVASGIADALVGNDREIRARFDDSVVRVLAAGAPIVLPVRRARGYAPQPLELPACAGTAPTILACGAEQKATLAFTRDDGAGARCFLSQHIGDVEQALTRDAWHEAREHMARLFDLAPGALACDLHQGYLTSQWARAEARRRVLPLVEVQHHHAHIAAVIAEKAAQGAIDASAPVVGVALDGTGAGDDGTIWGGEILVATLTGYERAAHLATWPLPGGAAAVRDPRRCAYALLREHDLLDHPGAAGMLAALGPKLRETLDAMIDRGINSPLTSSMGRFLDACAAVLGICDRATYDGEPAIELEAAASRARACGQPVFRQSIENMAAQFRYERFDRQATATSIPNDASAAAVGCKTPDNSFQFPEDKHQIGPSKVAQSYISELGGHFPSKKRKNRYGIDATDRADGGGEALILDPAPLLRALLDGIAAGIAVDELACALHGEVAEIVAEAAWLVARRHGIDAVALSGGVFMNRILLEAVRRSLDAAGLTVLVPTTVPVNDGCIAYGQAAVARARLAIAAPPAEDRPGA